ncbi:MAG: hypothetical protein HRU32_17175, partial [Rhodobacteraceae bacterium]|nr:hypothetical protein [Paracoccaceae bacterium]
MASPLAVGPSLGNVFGIVDVSVFVIAAPLGPIFSGDEGNDIVSGRLGQSLLQGGSDDDLYRKAVGERITIIDEEFQGGNDTLEIRAFGVDVEDLGMSSGLTLDDMTFEKIDGRTDGTADDLLITIWKDAQDVANREVRSLTVILDYYNLDTDSVVENLVLIDGLGGTTNHDLTTIAAGAAINANAQTDADVLGTLIAGDVTLLETQLNADAEKHYQDLFFFNGF